MYVQCSLQVKNFDRGGMAMSDCCRGTAHSAVELANGNRMYRCTAHEGLRDIRTGETGPIHYELTRQKTRV